MSDVVDSNVANAFEMQTAQALASAQDSFPPRDEVGGDRTEAPTLANSLAEAAPPLARASVYVPLPASGSARPGVLFDRAATIHNAMATRQNTQPDYDPPMEIPNATASQTHVLGSLSNQIVVAPPSPINAPISRKDIGVARWADYTSPSFVGYAIGVILAWLPILTSSLTGIDAHWRAVVASMSTIATSILTLGLLLLRWGLAKEQSTGLHLQLRAAGKINGGQ